MSNICGWHENSKGEKGHIKIERQADMHSYLQDVNVNIKHTGDFHLYHSIYYIISRHFIPSYVQWVSYTCTRNSRTVNWIHKSRETFTPSSYDIKHSTFIYLCHSIYYNFMSCHQEQHEVDITFHTPFFYSCDMSQKIHLSAQPWQMLESFVLSAQLYTLSDIL